MDYYTCPIKREKKKMLLTYFINNKKLVTAKGYTRLKEKMGPYILKFTKS